MHVKTTIAVPPRVLQVIDREAKKRKLSRSRMITGLLEEAIRRWRDDEITRRVNEVFSDPEVASEQRQMSEDFLSIASWPKEDW